MAIMEGIPWYTPFSNINIDKIWQISRGSLFPEQVTKRSRNWPVRRESADKWAPLALNNLRFFLLQGRQEVEKQTKSGWTESCLAVSRPSAKAWAQTYKYWWPLWCSHFGSRFKDRFCRSTETRWDPTIQHGHWLLMWCTFLGPQQANLSWDSSACLNTRETGDASKPMVFQ